MSVSRRTLAGESSVKKRAAGKTTRDGYLSRRPWQAATPGLGLLDCEPTTPDQSAIGLLLVRIDHHSFLGRLLIPLAALLVRLILRLTVGTCRVEIIEGEDRLENWVAGGESSLVSFWHSRTVLATHFLRRYAIRRGVDVVGLTSLSRDGELATKIGEKWGLKVLRGSASRGGREALRAVYRAVMRGSSPVLIPDGPHGPRYRVKAGVVVLGQMAQRPVLPMGFAATAFWRLGSWDRMIVPKPFARIVVIVGEPYQVPRELGDDDLERTQLDLERILDRLTIEAEGRAGVEDDSREVAPKSDIPQD